MLVATVAAPLPDALAAIASAAAAARADADARPDALEVRLDEWWPAPPGPDAATDALVQAVSAAGHLPLLATLRPRRQQGRFAGPEDVRLGLLVAAARAGFSLVDLEADLAAPHHVVKLLRDAGVRLIASDHTLPATPPRDEGLRRLTLMQDLRLDHEKLAVPTSSFADQLRCLELAHAHAARGGAPAIAPLGAGAPLRALLALAGNTLTYGHAGRPAVAGQPAASAIAATWRHWGLQGHAVHAARPHGRGAADEDGSGHRAWLAVLGHPVAHSLSPRLHNAALAAAGRPERFGALDVPDSVAAFRLLATVAPRLGLAAASVTAPHKLHAAAVAEGDDAVQQTGAANALRFTPHGAHATNTDAAAFLRLLEPVRGGTVAVLGAGGAARAALWAARRLGCDTVCTSRHERGAAVAAAAAARWVPWTERGTLRAEAWVQATPAMQDLPAPHGVRLAVELAYEGAGAFAAQAAEAEADVIDGHAFLLEQAVDAYTWWFGTAPDRTAMAGGL